MTDTQPQPNFALPPDDWFSRNNDGVEPEVSMLVLYLLDDTRMQVHVEDQHLRSYGVTMPRLNAEMKRRRLLGSMPPVKLIEYYLAGATNTPDLLWVYDMSAVQDRAILFGKLDTTAADWYVN